MQRRLCRVESDSLGNSVGGAVVGGARVGIRAGARAEAQPMSALELYFGGRSMAFLDEPYLPDVGIDLVVGWGNLGVDTRASVGFRIPIEMVAESRYGRITVFAAPSVAWGHIRVRVKTADPVTTAAISECRWPPDARDFCWPAARA